ncbi:hypothetical protein K431DRAFT_256503 [Polychaeton citri CBS 116435]|uniref:Uncharacterized protein n=1 Tax=Polychaeton citri CBS 116435 TaxID=1314669 RepID=A0A9P4Q011_9PEZI|nr:hypothetical protein K431DRAFT_256503 [Polychaeton citri CBS 116435]
MYAHAGVHLVRRGLEAAQSSLQGASPEYLQQLQHDADLYENSGPHGEIKPAEMLPVIITGVVLALVLASIRYTLGEVVSSLAMIESPASTAIIEPKPPAYTDEPDASLKKDEAGIIAEPDVEVTVIDHKPVTGNIRCAIAHLHRVGGFRARWRGLGLSILYHFSHNVVSNILGAFFGLGLFGHALCYVISSVLLARLHMVWTHAMIAHPSAKPFWRRMVARKQSKAILLPSLVFALAQQATIIFPILVAYLSGLPDIDHSYFQSPSGHICHKKAGLFALRLLAVFGTGVIVALAVLLPAAVTLTRIEAVLLNEDEQTIVPFNREAIVADIDMTQRGSARAVFVQAWRSFDRAARLRLIKLYAKMVFIQFIVFLVGVHLMVAEVFVIGGARLAVLAKSGSAQLQLAAIENARVAN